MRFAGNRDLKPTLDLRSVFKAVLDEHMHVDANTLAKRVSRTVRARALSKG